MKGNKWIAIKNNRKKEKMIGGGFKQISRWLLPVSNELLYVGA